jgi:hypothetical protein
MTHAKRVYEREKARRRADREHAHLLLRAVRQHHGEDESGAPEMVIPENRTPEDVAVDREALRQAPTLLVKRALTGKLDDAERQQLSRYTRSARVRVLPRLKRTSGRITKARRVLPMTYGVGALGKLRRSITVPR